MRARGLQLIRAEHMHPALHNSYKRTSTPPQLPEFNSKVDAEGVMSGMCS
jgi:hypothetical protein